ncbi:thrombospondin type 3 repeat-containing protein [Candidatus Parcubacteria bacterium]|nr:thrombospondin type 3 repeat-containing protein [Candidatus Parcubacteria bacterium]
MKFKIPFLIFFGLACFLATQVFAQSVEIKNAYRSYKDIESPLIKVPTVIDVPFSFDEILIERLDFAIFDKTENRFEPYFLKQELVASPIFASTNPFVSSAGLMVDNNASTFADFYLPENGSGSVQINLTSKEEVTASAITLLLDNYVALPNFIEIRAFVGTTQRIIVAKKRMDQNTIFFPKTSASSWTVILFFGQPLRIGELRLQQERVAESKLAVRFLAQKEHSYRIYFDPDRQVLVPVGESPNLSSAKDILALSFVSSNRNQEYIISDVDKDGVPDILDNCVSLINPNQEDVNQNGRGDLCDDFDHDGLMNSQDNCIDYPNKGQEDFDGDGKGDACDKEESRITERYKWIPWIGIIFAGLVLATLFILTAKASKKAPEESKDDTKEENL